RSNETVCQDVEAIKMGAIYILWLRELKRYVRSRAQIVASLGQPLLYLLALGFGLGPIFQKSGNGSYLQFVAPGVIGMSVLFSRSNETVCQDVEAIKMGAIYILWLRELKRYVRSRAQIVASLGQPLLYLLALGFGLGPIFQKSGNGSYLQFVAPGVIGMSVLFS